MEMHVLLPNILSELSSVTMAMTTNEARTLDTEDPYHTKLKAHPVLFASIGVIHTLLSAGVVFGWASLLPILKDEGIHLSASDFARVFTMGAIGNYLSSLPFGMLLDRSGPKICGILASLLFAAGLICCSFADTNTTCLKIGFTLIGFAGPAIQLPTLHLARLFPGEAREGGSGGAALLMSAQAGAFDGGTMVFAIFAVLSKAFDMSSQLFFQVYLIVPAFTLLTAVFFWPNTILPDSTLGQKNESYIGRSPYLSPAANLSVKQGETAALKDAPLSVILTKAPFYCLAFWVSVHILKLNFVVATINDQLSYAMVDTPETSHMLITIFGAVLPFGFVILPLVAYLLAKSTMACFQLANVVGLVYGAVLTFFPGVASYQIFIVFTSVAVSRQLVYSTVFHQTGELFGYANYGVLLGLTNIMVSVVSLSQGPLVKWAEAANSYFGADLVLLLITLPLFVVVYYTSPPKNGSKVRAKRPATEATGLLIGDSPTHFGKRSHSEALIFT